MLAALALLVPAGVTLVPFAAGNLLNSTAALFPTELVNNRIDLTFVSVLFHGPNEGRFGRVLVVVGLLGAVAAMLGGTSTRRAGAVGLLGFAAAVIGGGLVVTYYWADYRGPSPLYYELFGWPVYFVFLAVGLERAAAAVGVTPDTWRWWVPAAAAVIPVAVVGGASFADRPEKAAYFCYPFPPRATPIVDILRAETGIAPGVEFRGSALSLAGCSHFPNGGASWGQLVGHDAVFRVGTGNEHRAADLWYFGVPTGFEYNQFMAPAYYLMMTRMLGHPGDEQIRNVIVLRKPDPKYLASLGVRFVVTDQPQGTGVGRLRTTVPVPGSPYSLYLYEIPVVNTGQFSPTDIRVAADAAGVLAELRRPDFDYQTSAVTHEAIPETLCRAEVGRLAPVRGGYRVEARSPGTSLLVLPVQYSHCLELAPDAAAGRSARLVRVNLMQAGLLFTGDYRGEIRFRNRPDGSAFRRLQDYRDMKSLGVSPAVR